MTAEDNAKTKSKWRVVKIVVVVLAGLALVYWFWLPADIRARESSRRATCQNQLRKIGLALHMYSTRHGGKFPQGESAADVFSQLIEGEYLREEVGWFATPVYVCPGATKDIRAWKRIRKPTEETCSYEFVPGIHSYSPPDFIVAFERSAEHHNYRIAPLWAPVILGSRGNVLFVDGHATWMREEGFQEHMSWQREMMKRLEESGQYIKRDQWWQGRHNERSTQ